MAFDLSAGVRPGDKTAVRRARASQLSVTVLPFVSLTASGRDRRLPKAVTVSPVPPEIQGAAVDTVAAEGSSQVSGAEGCVVVLAPFGYWAPVLFGSVIDTVLPYTSNADVLTVEKIGVPAPS
ncbi:hypothetical protein ACFC58_19620 [Kitasatospora purpeofusca]|uniref:hypothetical protein n=1 Tax=Kitasatospora purpeofusca TaxID=67352 RepID=UPI0035D9A5C3